MKITYKFTLLITMGFLSSCFGQKNEEHQYLAGWEVKLNGDDQCQKFIETQAIDKRTAKGIWASVELVFIDRKLVKAYDIDEGTKKERKLNDDEIGLDFYEVEPHQIFTINKASDSNSYLGGEAPKDFAMPKYEFNAPFQYLGKLSNADAPFSWLPFELHLTAPIYLNFDKLFIDYSDPLNPQVINEDELSKVGNSYDDLQHNSEVIFNRVFIKGIKSYEFGYDIGHAGAPSWIQYPDIPTCPKSGETMKFVCQLNSNVGVETKRTNVKPKDDWYKQYFDHMNFWGDGDLFIFFEPESKVACYFIQNT